MPENNPYSIPTQGYNPLRFNPQMPNIGNFNQGPINSPAPNQISSNSNVQASGQQSQYTMQPSWQFGLNWNQIALSNSIKGIGAFLRSNNERNDFKNYNRVQQNPLSQLPENGNTSAQALYGMKQFKKGGYKYPDGGNTPYSPQNIARSKGPDADNANLLEKINYVLASGNPAKGDMTSGYNADQKSLLTSAYIWKQQNPGRPINETINGYFRQPVSQGNTADALRQKLNNIGYGPMSMYIGTEDLELQARQGNNMGIVAKKQGGKVKMADGGRFDNMDDFDEDDFDDLKDELDKYFKQQESVVPDKKEEPEEKEESKQEEQPSNEDQPLHGALDFLNTPQPQDEEPKSDEDSDKNLMDQLAGIAPIPKPGSETPHPSVYATNPTDDVSAFKSGIARVENAGYTEGNKNSSAFGKYQFTAPTRENVREQFFPSISKKDFETSYKEDPKFQERVMDVYSSHLLQQFGDPHKAALAFYLGPGKANYTNQPDYNPGGGNVSVGNYLNTFDKGYGKKQGGHIGIRPESIQTNFPDGGQIGPGDGKKPIVTNDPNDPRLKMYQDSLRGYDYSKNIYDKATSDGGYDKMAGQRPWIEGNGISRAPGVKTTPTGIFPSVNSWDTPYYTKPIQPYEYVPKEPKRSNVQGIQQQQQQQPNIPISGLNSMQGITQNPTKFSFTGRDQNGQQTSRYFPDLDSWKSFTDNMPWSHKQVNGDNSEAQATGIGNQFKEGGEYNLTKSQIDQLRRSGYDIEIIK